MKRFIPKIFIIAFLFCCVVENAGLAFFYEHGGEKIIEVKILPYTDEYTNSFGNHVNIGCIYKQFKIMFIPVWNYDIRWCAYSTVDEVKYGELTKSDIDEIANSANITLPANPPIPMWDSYGGKLVFAGILVLGLLVKEGRESGNTNSTQPEPQEMFCGKCGTKNDEAAINCTACSEPLKVHTASGGFQADKAKEQVNIPRPTPFVSPPAPQQFTPLGAPYVSPLKPTPVRILNSDKVPENPPTDLKGACVNCGQKLAFAPLMINTIILCPACNRETRLRDASRYT